MMKSFTLCLLILLSFSYSLHGEDEIIPFKSADDKLVCQSIAPGELESYAFIIKRFNKNIIPSREKKRSEAGLQTYLDNSGIKYFSAKELMTPHEESDALKCGLENLLPHQCIWPAGVAMLSIFDKIRELIGGPILFRNWWRPTCYNELVAGAKSSDHLLAKSMDLDFKSPHDRAVAQKFVCEELWKKGVNVQVGIGCTSLHIGLGSPRGKRFWPYESVKSCPVKSLDKCWEI
jgi:hypothetical protein